MVTWFGGLIVDWVDFDGVLGIDVRLDPGFVEFGAAGGFFLGDAELFADALADFLPIGGEGAEVIALRWCGGFGGRVGPFFAGEGEVVLVLLLAEGESALGEVETRGGDLMQLDSNGAALGDRLQRPRSLHERTNVC